MAGEDWWRLADYVIARRVELGMRDRRALAEASGVTERTLGKLENGQSVSPSTLGMVENRLGWAPGSCRRILAGGEPIVGTPDLGQGENQDPTLYHLASTPGLPPEVVRGIVAMAREYRQGDGGTEEQTQRRSLPLTVRGIASGPAGVVSRRSVRGVNGRPAAA
jgi:Helix-turn-helix